MFFGKLILFAFCSMLHAVHAGCTPDRKKKVEGGDKQDRSFISAIIEVD